MNIGRMDRRVRIERATFADDGFTTGAVSSWSTLATVWAAKAELRDVERVAAQEVGAEITARFTVRWQTALAGLTPKDRIVEVRPSSTDRTYQVTGIKELGRREGIEISAAARDDDA